MRLSVMQTESTRQVVVCCATCGRTSLKPVLSTYVSSFVKIRALHLTTVSLPLHFASKTHFVLTSFRLE